MGVLAFWVAGTYRVGHGLRGREDDRSDGGRADDGASPPKAIHFEKHASEIWTGQVPCPQSVPVHLAATSIDGNHVLNQDI